MDLNVTVFLLLALFALVLIVIGREYEERYPKHCDYLADGKPSTFVQQLRTGAFIALDYAGDMVWAGSRDQAIYLKRQKKTKAELLRVDANANH